MVKPIVDSALGVMKSFSSAAHEKEGYGLDWREPVPEDHRRIFNSDEFTAELDRRQQELDDLEERFVAQLSGDQRAKYTKYRETLLTTGFIVSGEEPRRIKAEFLQSISRFPLLREAWKKIEKLAPPPEAPPRHIWMSYKRPVVDDDPFVPTLVLSSPIPRHFSLPERQAVEVILNESASLCHYGRKERNEAPYIFFIHKGTPHQPTYELMLKGEPEARKSKANLQGMTDCIDKNIRTELKNPRNWERLEVQKTPANPEGIVYRLRSGSRDMDKTALQSLSTLPSDIWKCLEKIREISNCLPQ